mmetsp:Transcript_61871/g.119234  ORF Transcript_61871/g.119234 Transcript_61871/m.119234 type:complete len:456 (+) Transcript_61871:68-1435(+)
MPLTMSGALSHLIGMLGGPCRRRAHEATHVVNEEYPRQEALEPVAAGHQSQRRRRRRQKKQQKRQQQLELVRNETCESFGPSHEESILHETSEASSASIQDASSSPTCANAELRQLVLQSGCMERSMSLDGLFEEHIVCSCPTSTSDTSLEEPTVLDETPSCNKSPARIGRLYAATGSAASRSTSASGQSSPGPSSEPDCHSSDADSSKLGKEQKRGFLDFDYPVLPVFVKNTFLHADIGRPESLDDFFFERLTRSCPASRLGSTCDDHSATDSQEELFAEPLEQMAAATAVLHNAAPPVAVVALPAVNLPMGMVTTWNIATQQEEMFEHQQILGYEPFEEATNQLLEVPLARNIPAPPQEAPVVKISLLQSLELPPPMQDPMPPPAVRCDDDLWTVGGKGHGNGACKPCAHFHSGRGCINSSKCRFCHFCPPGELKRRQKARRQAFADHSSGDA